MVINYDYERINKVLQDLYNATGVNIILIKADMTYHTDYLVCENNKYCEKIKRSEYRANCFCSDKTLLEKCRSTKKPESHICPAGLLEIAIPILYNDIPISYLLLGQMRTESALSNPEARFRDSNLDPQEMSSLYSDLPVYSREQIESICNIAGILVKHILTESMLKKSYNEKLTKALTYIDKNLHKDLTVQSIADSVNVSKSALYRYFQSCFNYSISEYINSKRVEKSTELLVKTNLSIEDISQKCGFLSAAYYSKVFKQQKKTTPTKYRREHQFPTEK